VEIEDSPFAAGPGATSVKIHRNGRFAYVGNGDSDTVSAYVIDETSGALTSVAGSPFDTLGTGPRNSSFDPTGKFLYVANEDDDTVTAFSIDQTSGALSAIGSPVSAGERPSGLDVDASGRFVYVSSFGTNQILAFSIDAASGTLTPLEGGSATSAGRGPVSLSLHSVGSTPLSFVPTFAYVANATLDNVSAYSIDADTGSLSATAAGPFATGALPSAFANSMTSRFVYTANFGGVSISAFATNVDGELEAVENSPFGAGAPTAITIDPSNRYLYVPDTNEDIRRYRVDATTGVLTPAGQFDRSGGGPSAIAIEPGGKFAYVANSTANDVFVYEVDSATGDLTDIDADIPAGTAPAAIGIHPSGRFAYVVNADSDNISAYSINSVSGELSAMPAPLILAGDNPRSITLDRSGRFLYVGNEDSHSVSAYRINTATGALDALAASPYVVGADSVLAVRTDISGRFLIVTTTTAGWGSVITYTIDPLTGGLSSPSTTATLDGSPQAVHVTGFVE
jgi:6-phosphogluconolactonase (cycloisomerase 2 family)